MQLVGLGNALTKPNLRAPLKCYTAKPILTYDHRN
jgi:hypothetical protein